MELTFKISPPPSRLPSACVPCTSGAAIANTAPPGLRYALYQEYQRFLPDPQVITFTDLDGKLRAIKPDVTLSIAKTAQPAAAVQRFIIMRKSAVPAARATPSRPSTRWAWSAWARWTKPLEPGCAWHWPAWPAGYSPRPGSQPTWAL